MKNSTITLKRGLLLCACYMVSWYAFAQKELTILHTNDLHSRIEAIDEQVPNAAIAGKGGLIRIAEYTEQLRKENPDLLLFDCGDFSQGTPYYNLFKGEVEIKLMNAAGYSAATVGNHEFDFGMENLARLIQLADFPFVSANYDVKGTILEPLVKPYVILKANGLKVGVFGLGTKLKGMVQDAYCEGITYLDPYQTANEVAAQLKEKGCDLVICLSHLGYMPMPNTTICDIELIKQTRNIDLVLGGHSHTLMQEVEVYENLDGEKVYLNQAGKNGISIGKLDLLFD